MDNDNEDEEIENKQFESRKRGSSEKGVPKKGQNGLICSCKYIWCNCDNYLKVAVKRLRVTQNMKLYNR